jgi:hypothetical protein
MTLHIANQVFGRLTAVRRVGSDKQKNALWLCACECGRTAKVIATHLRNGNTKSCGCLVKDLGTKRAQDGILSNLQHGHSKGGKSPTYTSWQNALARCTNPNRKDFKWYGGKGVRMCKRWLSFSNFYHDMHRKPDGAVLGRKSDTGDYCPKNCRWESHSEDLRTRYAKRKRKRG